jgi:hypothetical protein|tara:strand:+ start:74 stop:334 length:261 start_codon:yes stop_codon:yes gene_type:complete
MANVKFWTPANVVVYQLPPEWRMLCYSTLGFVWGSFCSRFALKCKPGDATGAALSVDARLPPAPHKDECGSVDEMSQVKKNIRSSV